MMAWTDRHCRNLHRRYAPGALLFTEMVTTGALEHGEQWHLLEYNQQEHPLALQLGGNNPDALARCAKRAEALGYDEVNLNVGCPSNRVQKGTFGACLMRQPELVARCVTAMVETCQIPITVKCRLGVDEYDSDELLHAFVSRVADAGCRRFYIHARKAILGGLSPAQNRSIPPLQPHRVRLLKETYPQLEIWMNGGIVDLPEANEHLEWADGVMVGRAAYTNPRFLAQLHQALVDPDWQIDEFEIVQHFSAYVADQLSRGTKLHAITRHLLNCFGGMPGARKYRRALSDQTRLKTNSIDVLNDALGQLTEQAA